MARRRLSMRQIRDSLRLYWGQRLPMRQIARSVGIGLASVVESRDVVERCAPSSARISYGLRWFCSLLPLERQGKVVHGARTEGAAGHQPLLVDFLQHGSHTA